MKARSKAALIAALALSLPLIAWANHVIKVNPDQWQLIGITGYYNIETKGDSNTSSADLANGALGQAVVDLRDDNDNISWDANATSPSDYNKGNWNAQFSDAQDAPTLGVNAPTENTGLGSPYHSIVGLRTLRVGSIQKTVISFARPTAPAETNGKEYGASLISLYLVSPYSNGEPDVMVIFAANLLNQTFKISFKNNVTSKWSFQDPDAADIVYQGKFSYDATYDNPLRIGSGLTRVLPTSTTTAGSSSGYRSFANTIDLNVSDNIAEKFGELNTTNFQAFEGNFTAYQYDAVQKLWKIATINNAPDGGFGLQTVSALGEKGNAGSTNKVQDYVKGDFASWEKGYGYWVRIFDDANPSTTGIKGKGDLPGILANEQINGAGDYNGLIQNGWNLLAFEDGTLRYTASGFKISNATSVLQVVSPFGDSNVSFPSALTSADCLAFNTNAQISNNGSANALEVTCLSDGTNAYLISSKPFYIITSGATGTVTGIESLAGYKYQTTDLVDINGSLAPTALRTKLGEYALLVELNNKDYNLSNGGALPVDNALGVGVPSWYGKPIKSTNPFDITKVVPDFASQVNINAGDNARAVYVDSSSSEVDRLLLLAANTRFYVRDNVAIRVFKLKSGEEANNSVLSIDYGGASHKTATIVGTSWVGGQPDCPTLLSAVKPASATAVVAGCLDGNNSIGYFSDSQFNFDVKEINAQNGGGQLLVDVYTDKNGSVSGALKKVIQPSDLKKANFDGGTANWSPSVSNLTYTSVWAEDFPTNGPLYYLASNGFKPEMILTGVTSDNTDPTFTTGNAPGTISWKALDTTRDPKAWFDSANDFELFWTEKERGYWVYAESGYVNQVAVNDVNLNQTSVVTKHFNNTEKVGDEIAVFNWIDAYVSASVSGLTRPGYTSGETYTVRARLDSDFIPLTTTGAISGSSATFTAALNDFEVAGLRPTGPKDLNVTATDGLGGNATGGVQIRYVQPATPTISFSGDTLTLSSNTYATQAIVFVGDVSDEKNGYAQRVYNKPLQNQSDGNGTVALKEIAVTYPAQLAEQPVSATRHIMADYNDTNKDMLTDLRVAVATRDADDSLSVYSNIRQVNYVPAYSDTFYVYSKGEHNATKHWTSFGDALVGYETNTTDDIAFRGANGGELTLVYQPLNPNQGLANQAPKHVDIKAGGRNAQIQYLSKYEGKVFYVYDHSGGGSWYYGVFPGDEGGNTWGQSGYDLTLARLPNVKQTLPVNPSFPNVP
ncbi:MAG: hypothetical protein LBO72_09950 [Helicobacteraceae bacterium]|jgi:hypothetical protein|nr:hypothetical protein [Helicobacteraceae bacterium]